MFNKKNTIKVYQFVFLNNYLMKIVKITKVGYYYKIKLSDDNVFKFHESIIIKYKWFRKNIEIYAYLFEQKQKCTRWVHFLFLND